MNSQNHKTSFFSLSSSTLLMLSALWMVVLSNFSFFDKVIALYPAQSGNLFFIVSLAGLVWLLISIFLSLLAWPYLTKPVLIFLFIGSATLAYFMDNYGTVFDAAMINNVLKTHTAEVTDLLNGRLILYVVVLGLLPSILTALVNIRYQTWWRELLIRMGLIVALMALALGLVFAQSKHYSSFFREHREVRAFINPLYGLNSLIRYVQDFWQPTNIVIKTVADDATRPDPIPRIALVVVGETARADHWSLNGYERDTNPQIATLGFINLPQVWSCGTSTAVVVPCLFSFQGSADFSTKIAGQEENLLDVMSRLGVKVLWLDNNSDSKGVAIRVPYEDFKSPDRNSHCDTECRDEGMLIRAREFLRQHPNDSVLIVLHQMGNHGPAYYKRYTSAFAKWQPECTTNELSQCSHESLINAYDNAILYTDDFLAKTIHQLKEENAQSGRDGLMLYSSDHGESLGENGVYLHGLPMAFAPDAQRHVPAGFWLTDKLAKERQKTLRVLMEKMSSPQQEKLSQDFFVHTLMGFFGVNTKLYRAPMDLLAP